VVSILPLLVALVHAAPQTQSCSDQWHALQTLTHRTHADSVARRDSLSASPDDCAERVAAYLSAFLTRPGFDEWEDRFNAQQALERAMQRAGFDARLTVALGYLRYQQGSLADARRLVERGGIALADAEPPASAREQATAAYLLARVAQSEWREWRSFGELSAASEGRWACEAYLQDLIAMSKRGDGALASAAQLERPSPVDINVACSAQFETIMDDYFHLNADLKRDSRRDLETHFREASTLDPTHWPAYRGLASELAFENDWIGLEQLARATAEALPSDDHRPLLVLALATYRQGDVAGASGLFDSALALMPADLRRWYEDPESVLSVAEARALAEQPAAVRSKWSEAYWRSRRVSFLTGGNDRVTEHHARLVEADLLFGIPSLEVPGWNTAPGSAWVRYGPPLKIRDLALENGRASFWTYGPDPDLVFTRMLTYEEYRVHQHLAPQLDLLHEKVPTRFRPPGVDSVVTLEHQLARFRGDSERVDLMVVAGPSNRFEGVSDGEAGVTLLNDEFAPVARWQGRSVPRHGVAVTIAGVRTRGSHSLVVELMDRERRVLAQARDTLVVTAPQPGPAVSDVLLVRRADGPEAAARRTDLALEHLFGRTIEEGQDIGLVWEVYGLTAEQSGAWRYRVTLEVWDAEGRPLLARLLRGAQRSSTTLYYERTALPTGDRTVEWVNLSGQWTVGIYEVVLRLEDLVGGGSATAKAMFGVAARSAPP